MSRLLIGLGVVWLGVLAWPPNRVWCEGRIENNVGVAYAQGLLVKQDTAAALRWYERAAAHGTPAAAFNLGFAFQNGLGTAADAKGAAQWYERAARAGMAQAGNNLAMLYADGGLGQPDLVRARAWLKRSLAGASGALKDTIKENLAALEREMSPGDIATSDRLVESGLR